MDFARKQLEKYGWSDGKGLGRHENGISEPLRPRLKRSAAGVGHDAAAEYNDHWWSALYDKAAANVEVDGETKITTKDRDAVEISSKTWRINKKTKSDSNASGYMENFVKTSVLTSGGIKMERIRAESSSDDDEVRVQTVTDDELFKACGGRTAHKGARHGLRAIGKLARIEQQEKNLLKLPQYKGYSQAVDDEDGNIKKKKNKQTPVEDTRFDVEPVKDKNKRKKKKPCLRNSEEEGKGTEYDMTEDTEERNEENNVLEDIEERQKENHITEVNDDFKNMKVKKNKKKNIEILHSEVLEVMDESNEAVANVSDDFKEKKGKKNKKNKIEVIDSEVIDVMDESNEDIANVSDDNKDMKVKKNKKNKIEPTDSDVIDVMDESNEVIANISDDFKDMKVKKNKKNKIEVINSEISVVIEEDDETNENRETRKKAKKNKRKRDVDEKITNVSENTEEEDKPKKKKVKKNKNVV